MRSILFFTVLILALSASGQEFELDIHNASLAELILLEESMGSERIPTTSNHISSKGEAQPIKFLRKQEVIPDLIVYYFFLRSDTTMSYILYEWNIRNFETMDDNKKSKEFQEALIGKYASLKQMISQEMGEPQTRTNYSKLSKADPENVYEENSTWTPNDSTEIEMYVSASNYYEKKGMMTINPDHKIRLYVRRIAQEEEAKMPDLSEKRVAELNDLSLKLFSALNAKDIPASKGFLSDLIIGMVTDDQLIYLAENIHVDRGVELFFSGVQLAGDGNSYAALQFKYADDLASPPTDMIKIMFDDKNKVVAIQPVQRVIAPVD